MNNGFLLGMPNTVYKISPIHSSVNEDVNEEEDRDAD